MVTLRTCSDPTNLNKYNVRPVCNLYTLDEVSFKLKEKSKLLTAILTPLGVYVFNVLCTGLSNSNDLFEFAF